MSGTDARILFFASLRDATQIDELELRLDEPLGLSALIDKLAEQLPAAAMEALRAENVRVAVNQTFLTGSAEIQPGDEVAFMPPVTGG